MNRALLLVLLLTPALAAEPPANPDLTLRARAILRKYCAECHGAGEGHRGDLTVLDRAGLDAPDRPERPFLELKAVDSSQILQLIADGSMPPGTRPKPTDAERGAIHDWIAAGAPTYPRDFDEDYALGAILADIRHLPDADRPHVRYLSLHQLIPDADPTFALAPKREALGQIVAALGKGGSAPEPIDPAGAVLRIDLRKTGWNFKPFQLRRIVAGKGQPSDVNLFDVILIEYPYARLGPPSDATRQLTDLFLKPAAQVVPVAYLRGDWLADEFARSQVAREITGTLDRPDPAPRPPLADRPLPPPAGGVALLPLDAVTRPNISPEPAPFQVDFETWDAKTKTPRKNFTTDDRMVIRIRTSKQVFAELIWTNAVGKRNIQSLGQNSLIDANQERFISSAKNDGFTFAKGVTGREQLTLFLCEVQMPPGEVLKTKERMNERVIHRFYPLPGVKQPDDFDPAQIVKKTIEITVRDQ